MRARAAAAGGAAPSRAVAPFLTLVPFSRRREQKLERMVPELLAEPDHGRALATWFVNITCTTSIDEWCESRPLRPWTRRDTRRVPPDTPSGSG